MRLFLIYAAARNGTIGRDGGLPWHLPADLRRFKALTMGKPMIMGRKTFESFPAPLPHRRHIVLTNDSTWQKAGAEIAHSVDQALDMAGHGQIAVIGGAEILALFEPLASRIELTLIDRDYDGDTMVPPPGPDWIVTRRESHSAEGERPGFDFLTLERAA